MLVWPTLLWIPPHEIASCGQRKEIEYVGKVWLVYNQFGSTVRSEGYVSYTMNCRTNILTGLDLGARFIVNIKPELTPYRVLLQRYLGIKKKKG